MPQPAFVGSLDPVSWRALQKDLKELGPEIQKELNNEIKDIANDILSSAKQNASWSTRIPGALSVSVTTSRVGVKAARKKAPHARAFEGVNRSGFGARSSFRHPVYGNRNVWVDQPTRPYMAPAIVEHRENFYARAGEAVTNAARIAGWTKNE